MQLAHSKLDTVIRIKNLLLHKSQRELATIKQNREKEVGALNHLEEKRTKAVSDAVREMKAQARDVQTSRAFIQSLSRQIKAQEKKVDEVQQQEEEKREEVKATSQSKQMLEKVDLKRKAAAEKETERKAQRLIDVLAQRLRTEF